MAGASPGTSERAGNRPIQVLGLKTSGNPSQCARWSYWEIKGQLALLYEKMSAPGWSASAAATG
ncbi:MAG: hypothetical protein DME21_08870 [Verrucomicrobia bacterium]|nr:MAG: hypothetical protein DME21_08870 [Verrucomicrobiota bacterium]